MIHWWCLNVTAFVGTFDLFLSKGHILILANMWSLPFRPPTLYHLIFLLCIDKCFDWKWIFAKRCLGATINSPSWRVNSLTVLFWGFFFSCVWIFQRTFHECFVYCEEREAVSYSDGATTEDALWIPHSRVNLQSHILKERHEIYCLNSHGF